MVFATASCYMVLHLLVTGEFEEMKVEAADMKKEAAEMKDRIIQLENNAAQLRKDFDQFIVDRNCNEAIHARVE